VYRKFEKGKVGTLLGPRTPYFSLGNIYNVDEDDISTVPYTQIKVFELGGERQNWKLAFGRKGALVLQAILCQLRSYFLGREKIRDCWKTQRQVAEQNIIPVAACKRKYI
jgi:hypothetical protein